MQNSNRFRRIKLTEAQVNYYGKYLFIMILRQMPEDTIVFSVTKTIDNYDDFGADAVWVWTMIVESKEFDEVPLGQSGPWFVPQLTDVQAIAEADVDKKAKGACTCDLAYTGMKTHNVGCPVK